jgi:hypothetical protein
MGSFESALARSWKTTAKSFGSALKTREFLQKDAVLHFFQLKKEMNLCNFRMLTYVDKVTNQLVAFISPKVAERSKASR